MRTKIVIFFYLLSLSHVSVFSQSNENVELIQGAEAYQNIFFNQFFYQDFSYRFLDQSKIVDCSFGKKISLPYSNFFCVKDTVKLDSIKALSNIYLILGSQKNQALQIENLQRIGKSTFLYLNYSSIASLGFTKNSSSKNRSFNINIKHQTINYNLNADLLIISNFDGASGGVKDSVFVPVYSKRDLQQLDVNLNSDFIKKKYAKFVLLNQHKLFSSSSGETQVSISLQNIFSKYGYLYSGEGVSSFYKNVFYDSLSTNDTCGYSWLTNVAAVTTKLKSWQFVLNAKNDDFVLQLMDSNYRFNDWTIVASAMFKKNNFEMHGLYLKNIGSNFRKSNENIKIGLLYQFKNKIIKNLELSSIYNVKNVPFVYQKQLSNHYYWNLTANKPMEELTYSVKVGLMNNFELVTSSIEYKNRVFLNEEIIPTNAAAKENLYVLQLSYNDTINNFHLFESAVYNNSNSKLMPVIPIQSFTRIGYLFSMFKNNLKVEAGISVIYNDVWYATRYSPALDDFYLQSEKKYGGLTILNLFADFKIKAATVFLKVERVNIGWWNENSYIRDGYLAPPRTIRFGFNWPLSN